MKILLFTDLHMCPRASIINKWGTKYRSRLENCIASVNWLEQLAEELNCDYVISLGDFFDKPDLSSETITACNDIEWSSKKHFSLVGNHDASTSSLLFNSVNSLLSANHAIIAEPHVLKLDDCNICFLPYVVECDRLPINEYFSDIDDSKPKVILSHNDISGIQLGPVISKTGFSVEEIEANCDLFVNGHLHNGQTISNKIVNLGNLTGKDFGENAFKHNHNVAILDTNTLQLTFIENPYAYNFYKLQVDTEQDLSVFNKLKNNSVLSIKCDSTLVTKVKQKLQDMKETVVESRIILVKKHTESSNDDVELDLTVDHLARFVECCKAHIEYSNLLEEEISQVCK